MRVTFFTPIALLSLFGCATADQRSASVDTEPLRPGDCIVVTIAGLEPGEPKYYILDDKGDVSFPIVGKLHLAGFQLEQVKSELDHAYSKFYGQLYFAPVTRCH